MAIPKEILGIERPKNTIVVAYGVNKDRYAVIQRVGCKRVGERCIPINGPTIGHIVDGKYVPKNSEANISVSKKAASDNIKIDLKDWGNIALCDSLFKDIQNELKEFYSTDDALKLFAISMLRVCYPGIKDCELKEYYDSSFLSELYPNIGLSKNTVSAFLNNLGKFCGAITKFMQKRTANVGMDHHLLIDGTLKSNESKINSLSEFSRKARTKGTRDISVLYAFDFEKMEPVCSKCYPGNMLDVTSYRDFIVENGITKGVIVADKGFPASAARDQFSAHKDLHYLNPIKRNSKFISTHNLLNFDKLLPGFSGITYRKEKCSGTNKWLYSFRNAADAANEEKAWLEQAAKEGSFDAEKFAEEQKKFGTIILECDLDLPPEIVYKIYMNRWEIEIVMRYYKNSCQFDETRVHDDYSVIGSEFCDFLSTVLTFRLLKEFDKTELLKSHNYKKIMSVLKRAKKVKINSEDWHLLNMNPSQIKILQKLSLVPVEELPKNPRGRPKKAV